MGMTHRDRFEVAAVDVLVVGLMGGAMACSPPRLLSPLAPIGAARLAEPIRASGSTGRCSVSAPAGWSPGVPPRAVAGVAVDADLPARRGAGILAAGLGLSASGGSVAAVTGVRFALEPGSRSRPIPTRSSLVGATTPVLVVVSVITFASSLDHLVSCSRLYGVPANQVVNFNRHAAVGGPRADPRKGRSGARQARVVGWTLISVNDLRIGGQTVPAVSMKGGHTAGSAGDPERSSASEVRRRSPWALDDRGAAHGRRRDPATRLRRERRSGRRDGRAPAVARYEGADKAGVGDGALLAPEASMGCGPRFVVAVLAVRTDLAGRALEGRVEGPARGHQRGTGVIPDHPTSRR